MNKKLLLGLGAAAVLYYFLKNKTTAVSTGTGVPITTGGGYLPKITQPITPTVVVAQQKTVSYPFGFTENEFVQNPAEGTVYMLHQGQKLPITYDWWMQNVNDWSLVNIVPAYQLLDIPTGSTLSV